jgi:hypothetical protein
MCAHRDSVGSCETDHLSIPYQSLFKSGVTSGFTNNLEDNNLYSVSMRTCPPVYNTSWKGYASIVGKGTILPQLRDG